MLTVSWVARPPCSNLKSWHWSIYLLVPNSKKCEKGCTVLRISETMETTKTNQEIIREGRKPAVKGKLSFTLMKTVETPSNRTGSSKWGELWQQPHHARRLVGAGRSLIQQGSRLLGQVASMLNKYHCVAMVWQNDAHQDAIILGFCKCVLSARKGEQRLIDYESCQQLTLTWGSCPGFPRYGQLNCGVLKCQRGRRKRKIPVTREENEACCRHGPWWGKWLETRFSPEMHTALLTPPLQASETMPDSGLSALPRALCCLKLPHLSQLLCSSRKLTNMYLRMGLDLIGSCL